MKELTLITEEQEYEPGYSNPETIATGNPGNPNDKLEIKMSHGFIAQVGDARVKVPALPDWDIVYIEYPEGEMPKYRDSLMKKRVKIRKVTAQRIYFEQLEV